MPMFLSKEKCNKLLCWVLQDLLSSETRKKLSLKYHDLLEHMKERRFGHLKSSATQEVSALRDLIAGHTFDRPAEDDMQCKLLIADIFLASCM